MKACSGTTDGMESGGLGGAAMAATLRRQGLAATRRPGVVTAMRLCALLCCRPMPSPAPAVNCPVKLMFANCLNYQQSKPCHNGEICGLVHSARTCLAPCCSSSGDVGNPAGWADPPVRLPVYRSI